jgi:hypothetical protein
MALRWRRIYFVKQLITPRVPVSPASRARTLEGRDERKTSRRSRRRG